MKTRAICLLAAVIGLPAFAGSVKDLDAKNGFRDVTFGSPLKESDFTLKEDDEDSKFFARDADDLHIGTAELKSIIYSTYKGRLYSVTLSAKGLVHCTALHDALAEAYGGGTKTNRYMERYFWFGKVVSGSFDYHEVTGECDADFTSKALREEEQRDDKEKAKKATSDL